MEQKKETVFTMATLFYLAKSIISEVAPTDEDTKQVDTLIFNKIVKQLDK